MLNQEKHSSKTDRKNAVHQLKKYKSQKNALFHTKILGLSIYLDIYKWDTVIAKQNPRHKDRVNPLNNLNVIYYEANLNFIKPELFLLMFPLKPRIYKYMLKNNNL